MKVLTDLIPALVRLRERAGMTQEDLEAAAKIGPSQVSRYERGKRRPSIENLDAMLAAMGKNLFDLAREMGQTPADAVAEPAAPYGIQLDATALRQLYPAASRELLDAYIEAFDRVRSSQRRLQLVLEELEGHKRS